MFRSRKKVLETLSWLQDFRKSYRSSVTSLGDFLVFGEKLSSKSSHNVRWRFGLKWKPYLLGKNCLSYFLGQLLETFRLLFISVSGHTVQKHRFISGLGNVPGQHHPLPKQLLATPSGDEEQPEHLKVLCRLRHDHRLPQIRRQWGHQNPRKDETCFLVNNRMNPILLVEIFYAEISVYV